MGAQWTMADEQAQAVRRALAAAGAHIPLPEGGAAAWLAWALVALAPERPWIWITDGPRSLSALAEDAAALAPSSAAEDLLIFPAGEGGPDDPLHGERLRCLLAQPGAPGRLVLTCAQALLQAAPPPRVLAANTRRLQVGDELNLHQLAEELAEGGYAFTPEVQAPGEACLRGGLLDVWPATADLPLRIEFFGATVESLRRFEPLGQRSVARCQAANLPPLRPGGEAGPAAGLWDYLPPAAAWVWLEAASIAAHGALFEHNAPAAAPAVHAWAAVAARGQAPGCRFEVGRERVSEQVGS